MDSGEELNERERVRAELRVLGARLNGRVPCEEGVHEWGQLHACRRGFGFSSVAVDDDDHLKRLCRALLRDSLSSFQRSDSKTRARYAAFSFYIFLDTKKKRLARSFSSTSFLCRLVARYPRARASSFGSTTDATISKERRKSRREIPRREISLA